MADKVVQLKNKDGDKLYPVSVLPGERILWEDSMEPAPTMENVKDMTGATSSAAGEHGLVPAPAAGDQDKVLKGDGTWGTTIEDVTLTIDNLDSGVTSAGQAFKIITLGDTKFLNGFAKFRFNHALSAGYNELSTSFYINKAYDTGNDTHVPVTMFAGFLDLPITASLKKRDSSGKHTLNMTTQAGIPANTNGWIIIQINMLPVISVS